MRAKRLIQILTIILLIFLSKTLAYSQGNLPFVDNKKVHFGFSLGLNYPDFAIIPTDINKDVNVSRVVPGFSIGAISDYRINKHLNLRFTPQLILNQRELTFPDNSYENILSIPMYLPISLKYSSVRNGNFRPYLIGGVGAWIDWGRNKEKTVLLRPFDLLLEAGIGCNIYFSFFKLAPELKFTIGVNNMLTPLDERDTGALLNPKTQLHTNSINKMTTRMVSLIFNFE